MNNLSISSNTLRLFGLAFVFIIPIMKLDLFGGWAWSPSQWEYELMIQGIYMTLGIMMIISAKNPVKNSMFIWFGVVSSMQESWPIKLPLQLMKWDTLLETYLY